MLITVNNKGFVVIGASHPVRFPCKARHELMRWNCPGRKGHQSTAQDAFNEEMLATGQPKELEKLRTQKTESKEWKTRADGEKEVLFRNLLSAVPEPRTRIWEKF